MIIMACCKNIGGGLSDYERRPPRLIELEKRKGPKKMVTKKKRKRGDFEVERAAAVAAIAEHTERGVGVRIEDHLTTAQKSAVERYETMSGSPCGTIMLGGSRVSLTNPVEDTT